jgi:hypothetical protein
MGWKIFLTQIFLTIPFPVSGAEIAAVGKPWILSPALPTIRWRRGSRLPRSDGAGG